MKKYKIITYIYLGFLTARDQFDLRFSSNDGVHLEVGPGTLGTTIWAVKTDGSSFKEVYPHCSNRLESITTSNLIDIALHRGDIEEMHDIVQERAKD